MSEKWDRRFIALAEHIAQWSKDPSTKTGCILADTKGRVVGIGYNGFPRNVEDSPERLNDRPTKYKYVVHAEANAILNSSGLQGDIHAYVWPWPPCSSCAGLLIQAGIVTVTAPNPTPDQVERWGDSFAVMNQMFSEARVSVYLL